MGFTFGGGGGFGGGGFRFSMHFGGGSHYHPPHREYYEPHYVPVHVAAVVTFNEPPRYYSPHYYHSRYSYSDANPVPEYVREAQYTRHMHEERDAYIRQQAEQARERREYEQMHPAPAPNATAMTPREEATRHFLECMQQAAFATPGSEQRTHALENAERYADLCRTRNNHIEFAPIQIDMTGQDGQKHKIGFTTNDMNFSPLGAQASVNQIALAMDAARIGSSIHPTEIFDATAAVTHGQTADVNHQQTNTTTTLTHAQPIIVEADQMKDKTASNQFFAEAAASMGFGGSVTKQQVIAKLDEQHRSDPNWQQDGQFTDAKLAIYANEHKGEQHQALDVLLKKEGMAPSANGQYAVADASHNHINHQHVGTDQPAQQGRYS